QLWVCTSRAPGRSPRPATPQSSSTASPTPVRCPSSSATHSAVWPTSVWSASPNGSGEMGAGLAVTPEQVAGDDQPLHLVGALEDPPQPELAVPALDRQLLGVAHTAVDLQHPVGHPVDRVRAVQLRDRRVGLGLLALVDTPRGPQYQPADGLQVDLGVGDHPLDRLVVADPAAEGLAGVRVFDRQLEQAFARADAARRDQVAALDDPAHRQLVALADLAEDVVLRYPHVVERQRRRSGRADTLDRLRGPAAVTVDQERGEPTL